MSERRGSDLAGDRREPDENRRIYDERYTASQLELPSESAYDRQLVGVRRALLSQYVFGETLDLCCGTGTYLGFVRGIATRTVGLDFSATMLRGLVVRRDWMHGDVSHAVLGDARNTPFCDASFDSIYSFTALYYVPQLDDVFGELHRLLRPGGHAVLELGNLRSLNTVAARAIHRESGWAVPYHVPMRELRRLTASLGEILEWRSFQLLPMSGAARSIRPLVPLLHPAWKRVLGISWGGRMLDERLSSAGPLRDLAFRHLVVIRR